jgi:uncharacterized protein YoxC
MIWVASIALLVVAAAFLFVLREYGRTLHNVEKLTTSLWHLEATCKQLQAENQRLRDAGIRGPFPSPELEAALEQEKHRLN